MTEAEQPRIAVVEHREGVAALLSPLRRRILEQLHAEPDSPTGLGRKLGLPRQKLNYHVQKLLAAGLVELDGEQQRRGCVERRFRPAARAYLVDPEFAGGLGLTTSELQDRFSSAYLLTLGARLIRDLAKLRKGASSAGKRLATFALELDVRFRSPADRAAFAEELTEAVAGLASRYSSDAPGSRPFRFVLGGHPVPKKDSTPAPKGERQ